MNGSPVLVGIAGCSGSGKTTLAQELARELEGTHFHLDHYYRDLGHLAYEERCQQNFDHPDALEADLLVAHIRQLASGRSIHQPQYDFVTHTRIPGKSVLLYEPHFLLVDGIFALHYPALRRLYHLRVYVDTPDPVCYQRRFARDVQQRGRTPESVAQHYAATVRPMAEQFVRPSSKHADLIVDGTSSLDWSVEQVLSKLRQMRLLDRLELTIPAGHS
ncbi:uridine kinase [Pseudacidobacterium ailaaui]|jgi:uridine kinase|uniref:uridine kinase n=1 Tax=Pseudacidobacterium ailaaui TaxID=1382359 RepID=UPI0005D1BAC7|nr:uridine kinase [Pseudacidobacterium ailaaui]MBX6361771.1 uridine kinase [Pseudacidobacterium ailaaui]MCL6464804.1 uridine kinase [Pseudacidobacterium ailaaui]